MTTTTVLSVLMVGVFFMYKNISAMAVAIYVGCINISCWTETIQAQAGTSTIPPALPPAIVHVATLQKQTPAPAPPVLPRAATLPKNKASVMIKPNTHDKDRTPPSTNTLRSPDEIVEPLHFEGNYSRHNAT